MYFWLHGMYATSQIVVPRALQEKKRQPREGSMPQPED